MERKVVAIIPARYDSSRLPGKALLEIAGKPMICWVVERVQAAANVARVIVATDDQRIVAAVEAAGCEARITRKDHASGTDRIAEVAEGLPEADIVVNVQGDEPLISPETIERAVAELAVAMNSTEDPQRTADIVTTWESMETAADVFNPDVVKIVLNEAGRALYFSRSPVPYPRDAVREYGTLEAALESNPTLLGQFRKHTGLYVYRRDVLLEFTKWPQSAIERQEALEQLRALGQGVKIQAIEASTRSIGVDTVEDLERVRAIVSSKEFRVSSAGMPFRGN
ncbi:MAG: 3-deoxy-manno-octulosonate cytidylyltransferase [Acidobacteriota bacterium]